MVGVRLRWAADERWMVCAGDYPEQVYADCSTTEPIRVAANTGIEPVTHRSSKEPVHTPPARLQIAIFGDQAARAGIGQTSLFWPIGDSLSPRRCGTVEVSRAFTTEDVATPKLQLQGRIVCGLTLFSLARRQRAESNRFAFGLTEKYPHTAPLDLFPFKARGNDRDAEWSCQDEVAASFTTRSGEWNHS
jgi:hypothetical protein